MNNRNIQRMFNVIDTHLCTINGTMDYERMTTAITHLADLIMDSDTDESTWWIGERNYIHLDDLITGAYWHFTEWHSGQDSTGYAALSALGRIYEPNMECVEAENEAYQYLNTMAEG